MISNIEGPAYGSVKDTDVSGLVVSGGGTAKTTNQMYSSASYSGWDFNNIWAICDGMNYPKFQWIERVFCDLGRPDGVEWADLITVLGAWLSGPGDSNWDEQCDLNDDNWVGLGDVAVLGENWMIGTD